MNDADKQFSQTKILSGVLPSDAQKTRLEVLYKKHSLDRERDICKLSDSESQRRTLCFKEEFSLKIGKDHLGLKNLHEIVLKPRNLAYPLLFPIEMILGLKETKSPVKRTLAASITELHKKLPHSLPSLMGSYGITQGHPEIAVLAANVPEFMSILESHPQLATLFALRLVTGLPNSTPLEIVVEQVHAGPRSMAIALGLPDIPHVLEILKRLTLWEIAELDSLIKVLSIPAYEELLLDIGIPLRRNIVQAISRFDFALNKDFITELDSLADKENTNTPDYYIEHMEETVRLLKELGLSPTGVAEITSIDQLKQLKESMALKWIDHKQAIGELDSNMALDPPMQYPKWMIPLDSPKAIMEASPDFGDRPKFLLPMVVWGKNYLYKVNGDYLECALLSIKLEKNCITQFVVTGKDGNEPSNDIRKIIKDWVWEHFIQLPPRSP